ncbi:hypothetical protein JQ581_35620 [Bradyrhizobium liaoningense]|nr:hypothetical protein [Bradyrhizobium liaoningense]MBR0742279.1 hypothetical protein [Bradyrhizobium liaoningense]MBR0907615.1 hypothetical protein [Bradyrhizobium liaoningense]
MFPEDGIVLVGTDSVAEMMSAFRNYSHDVSDFLRLMQSGRAGLSA